MPLPSPKALVWKWIALGASVCAFVGGLVLAVIFLQAYVVPYRTEGGFQPTVCLVQRIRNISILDEGGGICSFGRSPGCDFCTSVSVKYKRTNSREKPQVKEGHLFHDVMVLLGRDKRGKNQCGCFACGLDSAYTTDCIVTTEHVLCPGETIACLHSESKTETDRLLLHRGYFRVHSAAVMHSVIWPSIFFIGGFVGIVFTWICFEKQNAKGERRPSDALGALSHEVEEPSSIHL